MRTRQLTIHHFIVDRELAPYFSDARVTGHKQSTSEQCSLQVRQNWIQFRGVQHIGNVVVGRLCKVRVVEKPKIGRAFDPAETDLNDDIIESCHFLYHGRKNCLLMQKNNAVSANPTARMTKLLCRVFDDLGDSGLSIDPITRTDVLEELIRNRGIINRVAIRTTATQRNKIHAAEGGDVEFRDAFMQDTQYKEMNLTYKIELGGVQKTLLEQWVGWVRNRKVEDVACYSEGDRTPIRLSEYLKFDKIEVAVDESGHLVSSDVFDKLQSIEIAE